MSSAIKGIGIMQDPNKGGGNRAAGQPPGGNKSPNNNKGQGGKDPQAPKRTRIPSWVVVVLLIGIAGWYVYNYFIPRDDGSVTSIAYSAFTQQVDASNVQEVSISESSIKGTLKQAIYYDSETNTVVTTNGGSNTSSVTHFQTTGPPPLRPDNQAPITDLGTHNVVVKGASESGSLWASVLFSLLPFLLFLGLIIFMGRQMTRGQQNVFGFGRSRARQNDPERPQVTFADVAGEDEAKRELTEVVDFLRNPAKYHQLGARLPRGVLLVGPPGTGKTLTARAVAGEAGVPIFNICAPGFFQVLVRCCGRRARGPSSASPRRNSSRCSSVSAPAAFAISSRKPKRIRRRSSSSTSSTPSVVSASPVSEARTMSASRR